MNTSEINNSYSSVYAAAVILAAGSAVRFGSDKIMLDLCGRPVICRAAEVFLSLPFFKEIVMVVPENKIDFYKNLFSSADNISVVPGGRSRAESSVLGLRAVSSRAEYIAIHDADRPLLSTALVCAVMEAAARYGAAAPAVEPFDTIKKVTGPGFVAETLPRETLRAVQTPQIFRAELIRAAAERAFSEGFAGTDDCSLAEHYGEKVFLVPGERDNIKITVSRDLELARLIYTQREADK